MLISFPLGYARGTLVALPELTEMAEQASEYILEGKPLPLRRSLDFMGIPRYHQPEAVQQLAAGFSFAAPGSLQEWRVQEMVTFFRAALIGGGAEAETKALRKMFGAVTLEAERGSYSGWEEKMRSYVAHSRESEIIRRAAYQVYCDGPLHGWLREFGGFVQTTEPGELYPLVEAGLAVFVGMKIFSEPVPGRESFIALKELSPERAERLVEGIVGFCLTANSIKLPPQRIVEALMEIPEVTKLLRRRVLKLLKNRDHTEEEIDYLERLPVGFAEEICESLEDEGLIRQVSKGIWSIVEKAPESRGGSGSGAP